MTDGTPRPIEDDELLLHVLNVGRGDTLVVELPVDAQGLRSYGVVDCFDFEKLASYLDGLRENRAGHPRLEFLCATHPHADHILGMPRLLDEERFRPKEFWDSGFRHSSQTYIRILERLHQKVRLVRVSSGMEWYFGRIRVTALAPSVMLRNTYGTYGVDINNASVVLRLEHHRGDSVLTQSARYRGSRDPELLRRASPATIVLGGDAEFDSWARINEEFPMREATDENDPLVKKMINMLGCSVLKLAHHGSMHSIPLEVLERMRPSLAVISTKQMENTLHEGEATAYKRTLFPHPSTVAALKETTGSAVLSTDGLSDWPAGEGGRPGSILIAVPPGGRPRWRKLDDTQEGNPRIVGAA